MPEPVVPATRPCGPSPTQVEGERAVERKSDHGRGRAAGGTPPADDRGGTWLFHAEDLQQARGPWQRSLALVFADVAQGGELAAGRLVPGIRYGVGEDAVDPGGTLLTEDGRYTVAPHHDGRTLLRQGALVGVDADAVHPDRGAVLQDGHDSGERPQPPGAVHHYDDVGVGEHGGRRRVEAGLLTRGDELDQLGDPAAQRLGVGPDQHQRLLPQQRFGVRQPGRPFPQRLARRVGEDVQLYVAGLCRTPN